MMRLSPIIAVLLLLASAAVAATQTTFTGPFTQTFPTTSTGTVSCLAPASTTLDCTLSAPLQNNAAILLGPLSSGSPQGTPKIPAITLNTCSIFEPITNGSNVVLTQGGVCQYAATCQGTCTGATAITSWAITTQTCASCFAITNSGVVQGGVNAANVTVGSYTITVTATNAAGTSTPVTQTINTVATPPQYVGPGDISATFKAWVGLRGYNNAYSGNAVVLCTPADAACETETISAGNLLLGTVGATCNNSTVKCTVKEWYDQTGNGFNFINTTIANRYVFVVNCLNTTLPCAKGVAASAQSYTTAGGITQSGPYSMSVVALATGTSAGGGILTVNTQNAGMITDNAGSNSWQTFVSGPGNTSTSPATDNAFHAGNAVFSATSTLINIDGVNGQTGTNSAPALTGTLSLGSLFGSVYFDGEIAEAGLASGALSSTTISNICNNQQAYWGTPSCNQPVIITASFATYNYQPGGPFWAYNSTWNAGSLVNGTNYTQSIKSFPSTFPNGTVITWSWPNGTPGSGSPCTFNVCSYPGVFYGNYANFIPTTSISAKQISAITTLSVPWNVTLTGNGEQYDAIFDIFTTNSATPGSTNYAHEVEIQFHTQSYQFDFICNIGGTYNAFPTVYTDANSQSWCVSLSGSNPPQLFFASCTDNTCTAKKDLTSYTLDLKAMMQWASTHFGTQSPITFSNGSAVITAANNFRANQLVKLTTTGSLPTNFSTATSYYVIATGLTASQFELSASLGGSAITAGSAGSGTQGMQVYYARPDEYFVGYGFGNEPQSAGASMTINSLATTYN